MELIKEIRDLSAEITALKDSVKKYDIEISQANVSAAKMAKMFDGYKGAKASAMSMEELEKATRKLIDGYNELEKAQNQYAQRQQALLNLQSRLKEQQNILPQAQRQALSNGDQAGAERLYQQYMSNAQALAQVEVEIRNAQSSMSTFNGVMTESATIANRYEGVLAAMRDAQGNINIDQLNAALREEKNNLADLSNQMREYIIYIKETQEKIKNGKIAPEDVEEKTAELEGMRNKVAELKNEYTAAAERARVFAKAAGEDPNKISLTPLNLPSMQSKGVKFPEVDKNLKAAADATKGVNTGLDDMIKKGLRFAGLSFGAGQLLNFGRQVMAVRGEFQQLEVAFSTLLGSEQKAQKLMQQLTKTAATTPFDLQSVSRGAKQLLAYGTAAEDVNDILIHLGDIAAGLSQPLDALVYLYGTTMVQGKMMTMDLRQFQNRGIPIAEQLAKQFGVAKSEVQGLVSSGRVTAEEFHKAIMAMSSDGGKFGGLMAAQSKTISGQISNIQDSISMMFNEIGKKSEGGINAMLSGVSTLVENYETVGKVLLSLVATYGVYKAALITVAAIEKARAATAMYNLISDSASISTTKFLTKAIWGKVKAQLASNAAMLANPAVLVTAGIVAMGVAIWGVCKALDAQGRAQNKVNKLNNETKKAIEGTKSDADAAISTIQSETATAYEKAAAYEKLKQIMPSLTEQYTLQQIATMDVTAAQKAEAQAIEDLTFKMKENQIIAAKQKLTTLEQSRDFAMAQGQPTLGYNADIKAQEATIAKLQKELDEMKRLKEQAEFDLQPKEVKIAKFVADKEGFEAKLAELQQQADTLVAAAREKFEKNGEYLNKMLYGTNDFDVAVGNNPTAVVGAEYTQIVSNIKTLQGQIKSTQSQIEALNGGVSSNITQTVNEIIAAENTLEAARKKYAADMSEQNKKDLETAESNLKTKTDLYQKATGQQWQATKELSKKILQEEENLARERESIQSRETSKRHQATTQYNNKLADISKEEKEWKEQNPNRKLPSYFKTKREVAYLEYTTNLKQLDEEFNDWMDSIERETVQIKTDIEISKLEQAIELADDFNTKLDKRKEINKIEIDSKNKELDLEKKQTAEDKFGEKTLAKYEKYKEGKISKKSLSKNDKAVFAQIEEFYAKFEEQRSAIIAQMQQEHANELLQEDLSDYEAYCEEIIAAAEEREAALEAIRTGQDTNRTAEMVEQDYNARVQKAGEDHGIDAAEKNASNIVARLVNSLADVTYNEVDNASQQFFDALKEQEDMLSSVKGMSSEERAQEAETTQADLDRLKLEEQNPLLTDEERLNIQDQIAEKEQYLTYLKMTNAELDGQSVKLLETKKRMLDITAQARSKSGKKTQQEIAKENQAYKVTYQSLETVRDTANAVANTFGGALSKKAKKALNTISLVADFGIDAVKGVESIVNGVSKGMEATSTAAASSMSAVEKASVILTIISVAVQLVMKIVEIASQFTKSAQLQNSIDDHLAKVDELEKKQQMIEAQYATSQGSEYYKGLAKSAEAYNAIIKENKAALADAEELYQHNLAKYGEDSDKTQEAKAQRDDLALQDQEFQNSQIEAWRGLMEELSGTSLDSFAENLADSLIEGFAMGKEGIDGVWEDTMDDLLRTMMRNQLATALKDQFQSTFDSLTNATKDGDLSQAEMEEFMNNLEAGKEKAEQIAGAYYDAMSEAGLLDDADAEGSQGFGQMTQDQADTLTARFTAVQMEMANVSANTQAMAGVVSIVGEDIKLGVASIQSLLYNSNIALQIAQDQLDQMQIIADNTAMLAETNTRLKAIEQNTGRL